MGMEMELVGGLIEPTHVGDTFACGIADIEELGPCARLTLYVKHRALLPGAPPDHFVVARIVIPMDELPKCIAQAAAFIGRASSRPRDDTIVDLMQ